MNWLSLLNALLALAGKLADWMRERQLIDAGKAVAVLESITSARKAVDDAKAIRDAVRSRAGVDPDRVRRDDGLKRH